MEYILLVIWTFIPYLLLPLGTVAAVMIIRRFILAKKYSSKDTDEEKHDVRLKKWNGTLDAIMITSVGLTIARAVIDYVYYIILRPDMYAITSFPWYANSLLYGAITIVLLLVCCVIKVIIKYKKNKAD